MVRFLIFFSAALLLYVDAFSQREDNIWAFGHHVAIDFNSGSPVFAPGYMTSTNEGTASISDKDGNMLFYSDGWRVFNREHEVMPNGTGLMDPPSSSVTHAAAICKVPGAKNLYYLFTLTAEYGPGNLMYNIIDMSLEGGLGDIIPDQKNILLDTGVAEKMILVRADHCSFWLITYNYEQQGYKSFLIDETGIGPGIFSPNPNTPDYIGQMSISPDRTTIANTCYYYCYTELAKFNYLTGEVSDFIEIDGWWCAGISYGNAFSPNSKVLYLGEWIQIIQLDISDYSEAAIEASADSVANYAWEPALRLGPDGKIYYPDFLNNNIAVINNPDVLGVGCNVDTVGLIMEGEATVALGIGNPVVATPEFFRYPLTILTEGAGGADIPENYCIRGCAPGKFRILRSDDFETERTVHYTLEGTAVNGVDYEPVSYSATIPSGESYVDISVRPLTVPYLTGPKSVQLKIKTDTIQCDQEVFKDVVSEEIMIFDSIYIQVIPEFGTICKGERAYLNAVTNYEAYLKWVPDYRLLPDTNSTGISVTPDSSIIYTASIYIPWSGCEMEKDEANIFVHSPDVDLSFEPANVDLCKYDTVQLMASGAESYLVYDKFNNKLGTDSVLNAVLYIEGNKYIVFGTDKYGCMDSAIIEIPAEVCCDLVIPNAFSPNGDGINDGFSVVTYGTPEDYKLEVFNRWGERIYISYRPDEMWDGTYRGIPGDIGAYYYRVQGKCNGETFTKKGDVTLIR